MQSPRTTVLKSPKFPDAKSARVYVTGRTEPTLPPYPAMPPLHRDASYGSTILFERALGVQHVQKSKTPVYLIYTLQSWLSLPGATTAEAVVW